MQGLAKAVVGLTGGIASGKSSVARELTALGVAVIDADVLAREVVAKGTGGLAEIVATFGSDVLTADGGLDRERLAAQVFGDSEARTRLNAIVHPRIARLSAERIAAALKTQTPYVMYEAPLLVETGAYRGLAALVVVSTSPAIQLSRLLARDQLSEAAAQARLSAQTPLAAKLAVADYVISNDAGKHELREQVTNLHRTLCTRFAPEPPQTSPDTRTEHS